MNLLDLFQPFFTIESFFALANIIFINIILSGDNAVVIAMSVQSLPDKQRRKAVFIGTASAVILRIVLTFVAARLLEIMFVKLIGGICVGWIAVKLLVDNDAAGEKHEKTGSLGQAIFTILVADLVMSLDNVLGVAGAARGYLPLMFVGLATSIPLVVFASKAISKLIDRFKYVLIIGAAILGRVAGDMILGDPVVQRVFHHAFPAWHYVFQGACAFGVVAVARAWMRFRVPVSPAPALKTQPDQAEVNPFILVNWDLR